MNPLRVVLLPEGGIDHRFLAGSWRKLGFETLDLETARKAHLQEGPIWLVAEPPPSGFDALALMEIHLAARRPASVAVERSSGRDRRCFFLGADAGLLLGNQEMANGACWSPLRIALLDAEVWSDFHGLEEIHWVSTLAVIFTRYNVTGLPLPNARDWIEGPRDLTLFLDRDGVINERIPGDYVRRPEDFHFLPGVLDALPLLQRVFGRILVVTNQQGIGKGWMSEEDLRKVHEHMIDTLLTAGVRVAGIYHCPGLASDRPLCRKPLPGMALQAMVDYPDIDPSRSVMVGDSLSDIQFGRRLGMYTVKVGESCGLEDVRVDGLHDLPPLWSGEEA